MKIAYFPLYIMGIVKIVRPLEFRKMESLLKQRMQLQVNHKNFMRQVFTVLKFMDRKTQIKLSVWESKWIVEETLIFS